MPHPAGTVFVLRSGGILGWWIRLLTRSRVNHAGICLGNGRTVEAQAAGAVSREEQLAGQHVMFGDGFWQRVETQAPGRCQQIADRAQRLLGRPYNYLDLIALAWACRRDPTGPPEKPNWWQQRVMDNGRLICSQLVDLACDAAGVHLFTDGRLPGAVTPGDIAEVLGNADWPQLHIDP